MEQLKLENGTIISYDRYGEGPPLVLVHGALSDSQSAWAMVKGLFGERFTVYAMNRRGRGESTATPEHRIEDQFADVLALTESIGEPAFLLGHSGGAWCAMGGAAMRPKLVRKLVLYEPPTQTAALVDAMDELEGAARRKDWDQFVRTFLLAGPKMPPQEVNAIQGSPLWAPLVADAQASLWDFRAMFKYTLDIGRFAALTMPVLLLIGSDSPRDNYLTDPLAAVLPDHRIVELQGQAHIAQALAPQLFVDTVSDFLLG